MSDKFRNSAPITGTAPTVEIISEGSRQEALLRAGALQSAIFNSANFSSIATDAKGVIQIFNVGAERMLGYLAADVIKDHPGRYFRSPGSDHASRGPERRT
jgi:PAS domain S-box-containing protein